MVVVRRPGNAGRKWPAEILNRDEVTALLASCSTRSVTGVRNRALIATLYRSGLRIAECLALDPKDIDHATGTIHVLSGKGGKRGVSVIDDQALAMIEEWESRRAGIGGASRLYCTLSGGPLYASYVRAMLKRQAAQAGIRKRVTPHTFRHSHAHDLLAEGFDMGTIQTQLRHASIASTAAYLRRIAPGPVLRAVREREGW